MKKFKLFLTASIAMLLFLQVGQLRAQFTVQEFDSFTDETWGTVNRDAKHEIIGPCANFTQAQLNAFWSGDTPPDIAAMVRYFVVDAVMGTDFDTIRLVRDGIVRGIIACTSCDDTKAYVDVAGSKTYIKWAINFAQNIGGAWTVQPDKSNVPIAFQFELGSQYLETVNGRNMPTINIAEFDMQEFKAIGDEAWGTVNRNEPTEIVENCRNFTQASLTAFWEAANGTIADGYAALTRYYEVNKVYGVDFDSISVIIGGVPGKTNIVRPDPTWTSIIGCEKTYIKWAVTFALHNGTNWYLPDNRSGATLRFDIYKGGVIVETLNASNLPVITIDASILSSTDFPATVTCGAPVQFGVTTTAGCEANTMVLAMIAVAPADLSLITVEYLEANGPNAGTWYPLSFDVHGVAPYGPPTTGFPLSDATSQFRVTNNGVATANTDVDVTISIVEIADKTSVLATLDLSTTVVLCPVTLSLTPGFTFLTGTNTEVGCDSDGGDFDFGIKTNPGSFEGTLAYAEVICDPASALAAFDLMWWPEVYLDGAPNGPLAFDPATGIALFDPNAIAYQGGFQLRDTSSFFRIINKNFTNTDVSFTISVILYRTSDDFEFFSFDLPEMTIVAQYPTLSLTPGFTFLTGTNTEVACTGNHDFGIKTNPGCFEGTLAYAEVICDPASALAAFDLMWWPEVYLDGAPNGPLTFDPATGIALFDPNAIAYQGGFQLRDTSSFFRIINNNFTNTDVSFTISVILYRTSDDVEFFSFDLPEITILPQSPTLSLTPGFTFLTGTNTVVGCDSDGDDFDFGIKTKPGCFEGTLAYAEVICTPAAALAAFDLMWWPEVYLDGAPNGPLAFDPATGIALYDPNAIAYQGGFQLRDTSSYFRIINKNFTNTDVSFTISVILYRTSDDVEFFTFDLPEMTIMAQNPILSLTPGFTFLTGTNTEVGCDSDGGDFDFGIKTNPVCFEGALAYAEVICTPAAALAAFDLMWWPEVYLDGAPNGPLAFDPATGIALYDPNAIAYQGGFQLRDTSSYFRIINKNYIDPEVKFTITIKLYKTDDNTLLNEMTLPEITLLFCVPSCPASIIDAVNNIEYEVVSLAGRCWYRENVRSKMYQDGTDIPFAKPYSNDVANEEIFGLLYTHASATDNQICPDGWHIPTDVEWLLLSAYKALDLNQKPYWIEPNAYTLDPPFALRGAGSFNGDVQRFENLLGYTAFWSSNPPGTNTGTGAVFTYYCNNVEIKDINLNNAVSVRCIRDL